MQKIAYFIDQCNDFIGRAVSWLTLAMVLVMFMAVIQRYMFEISTVWQMELVRYFHAILFLTAAGYTLKQDEHVRVDVFYQKASPKKQALINLLGVIIFIVPICLSILYLSNDFILSAWQIFERSGEYQGLPGVFLIKSFIWVFALLVLLQGVSLAINSLIQLKD